MALGATVQGAQHRREGKPNQDALGLWPPEAGSEATLSTIGAAVADGHGHARGIRAATGAHLAVDTALGLLAKAAPDLAAGTGARLFLRELPESVAAGWNERVAAHMRAHPFSPDELACACAAGGGEVLAALERSPEVAYGTTIILAAATPCHLLLAQLGDGDVLLAGASGEVSRPIPRDPELVANRTWSLSQPDAPRRFKTLLLPADAAAELVVLATDGYSNSYGNPSGFERVGTDMLDTLRSHGYRALATNLPAWLASTTEQGSGDDITVALLARATPSAGKETAAR